MTKDWSGNSKSTFITIGASNHTDKEREEYDFYATSSEAIDKLLKSFSLPKKIWECACGTGCLSERLVEFGHDVVSTDLIDRVTAVCRTSSKLTRCPTTASAY